MEEIADLTVDSSGNDVRLDVYLSGHLPLTRSEAARMIEKGLVSVDGKARKPSFKIREGMRIHARIELKDTQAPLKGVDIPLTVVYEDSDIIVLDKPAGLVVHPGAGENEKTLAHALIHRYPEIQGLGEPDRPGIVHRLDKLTSGLMIAARSEGAYRKLTEAFKAHRYERIYLAICYGHMNLACGRIETFMDRSPRDRKKMSSRVSEGREAITNWQVVKEWAELSLLQLGLETGRTHQIRVHLADIGHPVVGDPEYGGRRRAGTIADPVVRSRVKSLHRQMLHAWRLIISHPVSGERMEFTSQPPDDFASLVALLDERQDRAG